MYHLQIVSDIVDALQTIQLFEDTFGLNDGSDIDDDNYNGEEFVHVNDFESNHVVTFDAAGEPSCAPLPNIWGSEIATSELPKCFMKQPNDAFHNSDPYIYYETNESPTEEEYFNALWTLANTDEIIYEDDLYESIRCNWLHEYVIYKRNDITFKPPKRIWKSICAFFVDAQKMYTSMQDELNRINDIQEDGCCGGWL